MRWRTHIYSGRLHLGVVHTLGGFKEGLYTHILALPLNASVPTIPEWKTDVPGMLHWEEAL